MMIDLLAHLPRLENLEWFVGLNEFNPSFEEEPASQFRWEYEGLKRDTRHDFATAVMSTNIPTSLRKVTLDFFTDLRGTDHHVHQNKAQPNLVSPATKDPFSTSLRVLSYNLRDLDLRLQADESLF
jgi:hypothetical protein